MKQLVICEKPSLANNVCKALSMMGEKMQRREGYTESANYYVAPSFGHLFALCDIEEYQPDYDPAKKTPWTLNGLPFVPTQFKFKLKSDPKDRTKQDTGVKKQFGVIKKLIHSSDTASIIHCGDSDREGEIIVRIILEQAGNTKPVYRLWLPTQEEEVIVEEFKALVNDNKYDALAREGYARMYLDWLYGINLTRYASIKYGALQRVGRVIGAIVKLICDRDRAIRNFVPVKYFVAASKEETAGKAIGLVSKTKFSIDEQARVAALCSEYNALGATVKDKKTADKTLHSPKLFSQSNLQNALSKRYGFAPDTTLKLVQRLYEAGFVSYPRTPTEYLGTAEKEKAKAIIDVINALKEDNSLVFKDKKTIFDDSKIESHSAIIPTKKIPKATDFQSEEEKQCYEAIFNRFCAVFCAEDCIEQQTTIVISVGDKEDFTMTGKVPVQSGWKRYEKPEKEEKEKDDDGDTVKELPLLNVGDSVNVRFIPTERQTQPPKHYTVGTLNRFLRNPFGDEAKNADNDDEEYKNLLAGLEIGTEATRSGIIATAISSKYINLSKDTYTIQPAGEKLVDNMAALHIDMSVEKTAMMGKSIKDVYKGQRSIEDTVREIEEELQRTIGQNVTIEQATRPSPEEKESYGACPRCGKPVIETPKAFSCAERCGFAIWKDNKFLANAKKKLTVTMVRSLLKKGEAQVTGLISPKTGKKYDCTVVLEDTGKFVNIKPVFGGK